MGALTGNRKRGGDFYTSNYKFKSLNSPDSDGSIDTHISKKPKISPYMQLNPDRLLSSRSAASRVYRYPAPKQRLRREVHAPCRASKFGFAASSRPSASGVSHREVIADEMGNVIGFANKKAKSIAFSSLRYSGEDKEVIDVDAETVKDDVSGDSSIEEVEIVEDGREGQSSEEVEIGEDGREGQSVVTDRRWRETNGVVENLMEVDGKVAECNFQPSSSSAVSDLTNLKVESAGKMLMPSRESDVLAMPSHKTLLDFAKRREDKLSSLDFKIKLYEMLLRTHQLLRPAKRQEEAKKPEEDVVKEPFVPLTKEEEAEVARAFSSSSRRKVLVTHDNSNIEITGEILQCLIPGAWLNDEVINVYLELLKERERREPQKFLKCHFFSTFFYKKLLTGRCGYDFKSVRRWTTQKKLGYCLFDCDKIFVPIHKEIHWCLAVINKKDEKFQYLDSLRGVDKQVMKTLARYFVDEVKDKSGKDIDISSWKQEYVEELPDQENGFDCGMFMIKYADFYSRDVGLCFNQGHMPYFRLRTAKEILRLKAE